MVPHEKAPYERQCENWRREIKLEKSKQTFRTKHFRDSNNFLVLIKRHNKTRNRIQTKF